MYMKQMAVCKQFLIRVVGSIVAAMMIYIVVGQICEIIVHFLIKSMKFGTLLDSYSKHFQGGCQVEKFHLWRPS